MFNKAFAKNLQKAVKSNSGLKLNSGSKEKCKSATQGVSDENRKIIDFLSTVEVGLDDSARMLLIDGQPRLSNRKYSIDLHKINEMVSYLCNNDQIKANSLNSIQFEGEAGMFQSNLGCDSAKDGKIKFLRRVNDEVKPYDSQAHAYTINIGPFACHAKRISNIWLYDLAYDSSRVDEITAMVFICYTCSMDMCFAAHVQNHLNLINENQIGELDHPEANWFDFTRDFSKWQYGVYLAGVANAYRLEQMVNLMVKDGRSVLTTDDIGCNCKQPGCDRPVPSHSIIGKTRFE